MMDIKSICTVVVVKYMFFTISAHITGALDYCVQFDTDTP